MSETLEEFERRRHCSHTNATEEEVYYLQKENKQLKANWHGLKEYAQASEGICILIKMKTMQERG